MLLTAAHAYAVRFNIITRDDFDFDELMELMSSTGVSSEVDFYATPYKKKSTTLVFSITQSQSTGNFVFFKFKDESISTMLPYQMGVRFLEHFRNLSARNPDDAERQHHSSRIAHIAIADGRPNWEEVIQNSNDFRDFQEEADDLTIHVGQMLIITDESSPSVHDAFIHVGYGVFLGWNGTAFYFLDAEQLQSKWSKASGYVIKKVAFQKSEK